MALDNRTEVSGDEVVQIVDASFRSLRAERDELRALLRQVAEARFTSHPNPDGTFPVHLDPELMGQIARRANP